MGTLLTKKLETVYHIPEKMQEKTQKKSLAFLTVEACPFYLGTSGENTHSSRKHFFAVPAMRPGDSQGGGFSAAPLEPASYQCSCRDKNIAPGGTRAGNFCEFENIILILNKMISSFYLSRFTADRLGGGKKCIDFVF